jgi:PmbA protein
MMRDLLTAAARKAEHAEVYFLQRRAVPIRLDNQGPSAVKMTQTAGAALRVVCDGRLGYATTTDFIHPEAVVDAATGTAGYGDPVDLGFPGSSPDLLKRSDVTAVEALSAETMMDKAEEIHQIVRGVGEDVEVEVTVETVVDRVRILNTRGLDVTEAAGLVRIAIEAVRTRAGDIYIVADSVQDTTPDTLGPDIATRRVVRMLNLGDTVVPAPRGALPVVFTPAGALAVFLPLVFGLDGKAALLGVSPLRDKLGQSIFDPRLSIADDGRMAGGSRAASFDDEGVPSRRTTLIEEGVLSSFYYDLRTAALAGTASTGNGYKGGVTGGRNFRPATASSISHFIVGDGDSSQEELIRGIKKGLLVDSVLGLGQGNLNAGDFSNNLSAAFLVEDGKIVGRVKNAMIAGNSYDLLRDHVIGLGNDSAWMYGRFRSPSIALDGVKVAAQ